MYLTIKRFNKFFKYCITNNVSFEYLTFVYCANSLTEFALMSATATYMFKYCKTLPKHVSLSENTLNKHVIKFFKKHKFNYRSLVYFNNKNILHKTILVFSSNYSKQMFGINCTNYTTMKRQLKMGNIKYLPWKFIISICNRRIIDAMPTSLPEWIKQILC